MKRLLTLVALSLIIAAPASAAAKKPVKQHKVVEIPNVRPELISIETANTQLLLCTTGKGELRQVRYGVKLDTAPFEKSRKRKADAFPVVGGYTENASALGVRYADGNLNTELYVAGVGRSSTADVSTTEISLKDYVTDLQVKLIYEAYVKEDVIAVHSEILNGGKKPVTLTNYASASLNVPGEEFLLTQFHGDWAFEMQTERTPVPYGLTSIESRRGVQTTQRENPSFLLSVNAREFSETAGEVIAGALEWSGNYKIDFSRSTSGNVDIIAGINPFNSEYPLAPGKVFETPRMVWTYSPCGAGQASRNLHRWARKFQIYKGGEINPTLLNSWEGAYFTFTTPVLTAMIDDAAAMGLELFVLDDGWFGKRNNDWTSLGDWDVFTEKLPNGLSEISEGIHARGMLFGLWFEPEMISPDSNLYRAHPDWCLHCTERSRTLGRHQLVLDMSRKDVVDYLFEKLSAVLSSCKIDYVKWDFNRSPSDVGSALLPVEKQQEVSHRFYLGLYDLLERLNKKFPHILFESCSGGGGRFDPAMLYYMSQTWTSDNTDGLSRLAIQEGTSIAYPASAMSCHVSAVPNHQVGRVTSLSLRGHVAMAGTFGYELDLNKLSDLEKAEIKEQVVWYKDIRHTAEFGDLYRLRSPRSCTAFSESPLFAWESVEKDKSKAVVTAVWSFSEANESYDILKLEGLDEKANYKIKSLAGLSIKMLVRQFFPSAPDSEFCVVADDTVISGEELMNIGLCIINRTNYGGSLHFKLERV